MNTVSVERNRAVARQFISTMKQYGGLDESLVTEDFHWWASNMGMTDLATLKGLLATLGTQMPILPDMHIVGMAAEEDRVAVEVEGKCQLPDGRRYDNHYHFMLLFRDGRIRLAKEYVDTKLVADTFGFGA
jgi:ketosteroid isomerase-like protein